MINDNSPTFDDVLTQALRLPPDERIAMIEALAASFRRDQPPPGTSAAFTDEEIAVFMTAAPLSPAEMIAQGLTGTWADDAISSGSEWVNEQKSRRRERRQW
jgi:hypothetical protein